MMFPDPTSAVDTSANSYLNEPDSPRRRGRPAKPQLVWLTARAAARRCSKAHLVRSSNCTVQPIFSRPKASLSRRDLIDMAGSGLDVFRVPLRQHRDVPEAREFGIELPDVTRPVPDEKLDPSFQR
jgi:hypothetical protein